MLLLFWMTSYFACEQFEVISEVLNSLMRCEYRVMIFAHLSMWNFENNHKRVFGMSNKVRKIPIDISLYTYICLYFYLYLCKGFQHPFFLLIQKSSIDDNYC